MAESAKQSKRRVTNPLINVGELPSGRELAFEIVFNAEERAAAVQQLDLVDLTKLRFAGTLSPKGKSDWVLRADLGASASQSCVVTLEPVKTRVDEPVSRTYETRWQEPEPDSVSEMDEDVESEPLPEVIDLGALAIEALALALPDYPRKEDADLGETVFTESGVKPMTDEDAKPFAGLAALKAKMESPE